MGEKMLVNLIALDQYIELLGDEGNEFIVEIINTFLHDAPKQFSDLCKSLLDNDSVVFRRVAHTLKTGCATVGADNLSKDFLALELIGESGDLTSTEECIKNCKKGFSILKEELLQKIEILSV